jgi:hypothetical protein
MREILETKRITIRIGFARGGEDVEVSLDAAADAASSIRSSLASLP